MKLKHHELEFILDDDWWSEAGMAGFKPSSNTYNVDSGKKLPEQRIFEVSIEDIGPVLRNPGIGIFNDSVDTGMTARERVVKILSGFRSGSAIPPIEIVPGVGSYPHKYKPINGTHRLYCSLAAGFIKVPAVEGFDWSTLDQK